MEEKISRARKLTRAERYGKVYGENAVNDFLDHPEWKGPNFTWVKLAGHAERMAMASFDVAIYGEEAKALAGKVAYETAKKLILEKGLAELSEFEGGGG